MRMVKSYGSKSRQMMWLNAKPEGITIGSHIYMGSESSIDFFLCRLTRKEISIRNLTFNNGGL